MTSRVHRYIRVGSEGLNTSTEGLWRFAFAVAGLSRMKQTDIQIAEQFPPYSHDKVLNARRAYVLFALFRGMDTPRRKMARSLRTCLDKSSWEVVAKFYAAHGSLEDAWDDLYHNKELSARDLDDQLREKYNGRHSNLQRSAGILAKSCDKFVQDVMSWADGADTPEGRKVAIRLARALREAYVPFAEQVELVRDVLREEQK